MDLGQLYGATKLGAEPTVVLQECFFADEISGERVPAREVKEDVLSSECRSRLPVVVLEGLNVALHHLG